MPRDWPDPRIDPNEPSSGWRVLDAIVAVALLAGLIGCAAQLLARKPVPIVPAGQHFTCTATELWDGDGPIWCREGPRVRLARINARELDGSCRPGAPCPTASGTAARDHLAQLLGGSHGSTRDGHLLLASVPLRCRSDGWGKGDRTAAWCSYRGVDLSAAMIRDRFAAPWRDPRPS